MDKLIQNVKKELHGIGEKGLTTANLDTTDKLVDILKDIYEIQKMEGGKEMQDYGRPYMYERGGYNTRGYDEGGYNGRKYYIESEEYGRRGGRGGYNGPMRGRLERVYEGMEEYEYGRDRYQHGGGEERIYEGLEKMMYAICSFVESAMDFAETPQEKEIIRKHLQKMSKM